MTRIKIIIFTIIFLISNKSISQENKAEMAIYNIGLGSLVGGIGAIINKKPDEKTGKVFLKGLWQGGLGGYFVYESKNFLLNIPKHNKLEYSWGAKFINSIGTSIIENASLNTNFWDKWHMNIGFNRFEIYTTNKIKFKYKIMPVSLLLTGVFAKGNKFELSHSLKTGELIFSVPGEFEHRGATWGKLILLEKNRLDDFGLITHEIVHSYQYEDFNFVNTILYKPTNLLLNKSKFGKKLNEIFYFDLQAPLFGGLYLLENLNQNCYYDNFFENEAGFFSNTRFCD